MSNTQLIKPTLKTPFHIDYNWWERESRELRIYLRSHLCAEHRVSYENAEDTGQVDWVDPETAEVQQLDGLQLALRNHCARLPNYIEPHTSLVDAIFRVFLANGNTPLSSVQIAERINRPHQANTILKTLSGGRVYKGLRPYLENSY